MKRPIAVRPPRVAESLLQSLGAHHDFVDDVLGDLAEEYSDRITWDGVWAARRWYCLQGLRTAPYLLRDWRRRIGWRDGSALIATMVVAALITLPVSSAVAELIAWLAMRTTGIPLGTQLHHWAITGDRFPWVLPAIVANRIIPTGVSGWVAASLAKRGRLTCALLLAAVEWIGAASLSALQAPTLGRFVAQLATFATPWAVSCIAGGVAATLWLDRVRWRRANALTKGPAA